MEDSSSQPSEGTNPIDILIWASGLQNYETIHFCYLSHPVCDILLWKPYQNNTGIEEVIPDLLIHSLKTFFSFSVM